MDLAATLRSADELYRLTPEDYVAEFPALATLLQNHYGEKFQSVTLKARLPSGPIALSSDHMPPVPQDHVSLCNSAVNIIVYTAMHPGFPTRHYHYSLDHLTVMPWSFPFGRVPIKDWINVVRSKKYLHEAKRRLAPIKEELMAAAWAPQRVERLLAVGGYEALDS